MKTAFRGQKQTMSAQGKFSLVADTATVAAKTFTNLLPRQ